MCAGQRYDECNQIQRKQKQHLLNLDKGKADENQ